MIIVLEKRSDDTTKRKPRMAAVAISCTMDGRRDHEISKTSAGKASSTATEIGYLDSPGSKKRADISQAIHAPRFEARLTTGAGNRLPWPPQGSSPRRSLTGHRIPAGFEVGVF